MKEQIDRVAYRMYYKYGSKSSCDQINDTISQYKSRYASNTKEDMLKSVEYWNDVKNKILTI